MADEDNIRMITKTVPTFFFIGVTTSQSSIMKVFPRWMEALGRPEVVIEGIDHQTPSFKCNYSKKRRIIFLTNYYGRSSFIPVNFNYSRAEFSLYSSSVC